MTSRFSAGAQTPYAELPVEVNYLNWKRGNAQMEHLKETDPGSYFGGWSASVANAAGDEYPKLPLPIVTRKSEDGRNSFQRYASNVINFLPVAHRTRYEQRIEMLNDKGQKEEKVTSIIKNYVSGVHKGYQPMKQVFGLVFAPDMSTFGYAIVKLNKWNSYLSFTRAEQAWMKVKVADGFALVRQYGSVGIKDKKGLIFPNIETYGEGKSTPIEAVYTDTPIFVPVTPELDSIWEQSQEWANCERWNAAGKIADEPMPELPPMPEDIGFADPANPFG